MLEVDQNLFILIIEIIHCLKTLNYPYGQICWFDLDKKYDVSNSDQYILGEAFYCRFADRIICED